MKKFALSIVCVVVTFCMVGVSQPFAEDGIDLMFATESNSVWILDKATHRLVFLQYEGKNVWKSNIAHVPAEFNLDKSEIKAVGMRGTSLFVCDGSQGLVVLFEVSKDRSVTTYPVISAREALKPPSK